MRLRAFLLVLCLLAVLPASALALTPKNGTYTGKSSQKIAIKFKVKDGKIKAWRPKVVTCPNLPPTDNSKFMNIRFNKKGKVKYKDSVRDTYTSYSIQFLSRTRAKGTL